MNPAMGDRSPARKEKKFITEEEQEDKDIDTGAALGRNSRATGRQEQWPHWTGLHPGDHATGPSARPVIAGPSGFSQQFRVICV